MLVCTVQTFPLSLIANPNTSAKWFQRTTTGASAVAVERIRKTNRGWPSIDVAYLAFAAGPERQRGRLAGGYKLEARRKRPAALSCTPCSSVVVVVLSTIVFSRSV